VCGTYTYEKYRLSSFSSTRILHTVYDDDVVVEKKVQEYNWKTYVFDDKNKKETKT